MRCIGLHQMSEFTVSALTFACICDRLIFLVRGCWTVFTIIYCITPRYTSGNDRDKSQAVIRRTFTTEALVRWRSSGICGEQNGTETGFRRVLLSSPGPGVAQWLRHCATSRAVPGSNPVCSRRAVGR